MDAIRKYPWYEIVEGDDLAQGDILLDCYAVRVAPDTLPSGFSTTLRAEIEQVDAIVISQSCDLVNDKINDVLLCAHFDLSKVMEVDPSLKSKLKQILNGQVYRHTLLPRSDFSECPMGIRIVDFNYVFMLPKQVVRRFAAAQGKRLRLCPPYREHLSQAFARFFMRVGLPQQIELPE